nr:hypothetical protein [Tanacetum cinerariifolium]
MILRMIIASTTIEAKSMADFTPGSSVVHFIETYSAGVSIGSNLYRIEKRGLDRDRFSQKHGLDRAECVRSGPGQSCPVRFFGRYDPRKQNGRLYVRPDWTEPDRVLNMSGKDYKKLIFTDSKGMKLSALIYEGDLRYFNKLLTQYKRSRLSIKIQDETTTLCATICTLDAEKIMPFTALQLRESEEMGIDLFEDIATSLQQHTVVAAFIRTYEAFFNGQRETKVSVVKVYTSGQVLSSADLVSLPAHGQTSESSTDVNTPAAITTPSQSR